MNKPGFLSVLLTMSVWVFALLGGNFRSYAQEQDAMPVSIRLKGTVVDDKEAPLPGVAVRVAATDVSTQTDANGNFSIEIKTGRNVSLVFYYLGMKDETVYIVRNGTLSVVDGSYLKVKMREDTEVLSEVVVTGYANISKKSFTGSATSVSREDIQKAAPHNALAALQIFDPSMRLAENIDLGSNPNAIPNMTVRGQSSVGTTDLDQLSSTNLNNNPNLPTFILDGFEVSVSKIYDLDVNRIESMTLLKDAAATAMYGSRAANGVLVVTTVPPKAGKVGVSYTLDLNLQTPDLSWYHLMNAEQKLEAERIAGLYVNDSPNYQLELEKIYNKKLQQIERGVYTDWMKLPLRNSLSHKHSLYVDGGEGNLRYGIDLMYDRNNGVMKSSFKENIAAGLSLTYTYKGLNIRNYVTFDNVRGKESPYGTYSEFVKMNPYDTYLDDFGNVTKNVSQWGSSRVERNPMFDSTLASFDTNSSKQFKDNFDVRWNITDHLNVRAGVSLWYDIQNNDVFRDPESTWFLSVTDKGDLRQTRSSNSGYDVSTLLYYNQLLKKHHINLSFGFNARETTAKSSYYHYVGFPNGGYSSPEFAEELKYKPTTSSETQRLFGTLLTMNYSYDNIYLVDVSGRVDGSSQFGSERKYAPFGSAGIGLNINNYDAVRSAIPWLTQLKLRASYGQTGKVNFPSYTAQDKFFIVTDQWFPTGSAAKLNYMGNPNLKWETTDTFEFGGELTLFDQILYIKANRYYKRTKDLISDMTIPTSSGFAVYKENVGVVMNKGWELNVRAKIYDSRFSRLYLFTNLAHNKNRLVKISNSMKAYNDSVNELFAKDALQYDTPILKYYEGASMSSIYGMESLGIDPASGREMYQYSDGTVGYKWIGSENKVIGDTEPLLTGSFGANFYWKGFTVDAYFRFDCGGQIYNTTLLDKIERADPYYNCDVRVITDRWQKPGDVTPFKSLQDYKAATQPTSRFVQNNNWLKLSSLSIGYDVPQKYLRKAKISRLKFQLNCSDIFTVSSIQIEKGISYPFARGYALIANITF